ncbi:MAG: hypothetical protein ACPL2E_07770, partial [Conexivisphaera sp.]
MSPSSVAKGTAVAVVLLLVLVALPYYLPAAAASISPRIGEVLGSALPYMFPGYVLALGAALALVSGAAAALGGTSRGFAIIAQGVLGMI